MEFDQIKELALLVDSTELTELEIENGDFRLRIQKEKTPVPVQVGEKIQSIPDTGSVTVEVQPEQTTDGLIEIVAPMVGTFYRAPAPDAPPYVQIGDKIEEGQVLFIIEAMKIMNEVESEIAGVVKEVLVEDGQAVEYGQPLLLIDPKV